MKKSYYFDDNLPLVADLYRKLRKHQLAVSPNKFAGYWALRPLLLDSIRHEGIVLASILEKTDAGDSFRTVLHCANA